MHVIFFITSKLWLKLKYIQMHNYKKHAEQTNGNKYMPNFTLFQNFADSCLQNDPFFLISRIRASHWKKSPFFAKMGKSVVYVLVEGEPGVQ